MSGTKSVRTPRQPTANLETRRGRRANLPTPPTRGQQVEDKFARFFVESLDLLCIAGLDGYFKYLNPAWTAHLGWSLEDLMTRPFLDFVHADDRDATRAEVGKLAEGGVAILFENRYRHQDGSLRWLQWNARPAQDERLIYATARDVTRRKRLEREILDIVDREKERLGRDLHDGLCQSLAGISALSTTLARRLAAASDPASSAMAAEIGGLLSKTIGEARDLARGLGPVGLHEDGLSAALEALALNVRHMFRVSCSLEAAPSFPALLGEVETHVFRIGQEAVGNALAHGNAARVEIKLDCKDGKGRLTVRDDGVGVPEEAPHPDGAGMHTMAYRAHLIGGSLEVRRRGPRGTAVHCVFPLARNLRNGRRAGPCP